jgi:hypothetical protein
MNTLPAVRVVVAALVTAVVLPCVVIGQTATKDGKKLPDSRPSCSTSLGFGRRIFSLMGIVEFRVPRSAHITRALDADYVKYSVRYGSNPDAQWLGLFFGVTVGGESSNDLENTSIKWTAQKWRCHQDEDGTDWRGASSDGRRWRHIAVPFGFAAYEGVTPKAAAYFDKILDTMCCGKCPSCEH